jgi:hypothetical protein
MITPEERDAQPGISAVLTWRDDLDGTILDLAAVLSGLVGQNFEIILVAASETANVADLRARAPGLSLQLISHGACDAARFDLLLISAEDGKFDVRELNRLMEAIDKGADLAAGYRPGRVDGLVRGLSRWGLPFEVDYAFQLIRRGVCIELGAPSVARARRSGYRVAEVPVSDRRPTLGAPVSAETRAA